MTEPDTGSEDAARSPRWVWRGAVLYGVFLLVLTPMAAGVWIIWTTGEPSVVSTVLITFGPVTIGGLMAVMTTSLKGSSLQRRRRKAQDQEDE